MELAYYYFKILKNVYLKARKNNNHVINLLVQRKLGETGDINLEAIQSGDIASTVFYKALHEGWKYHKHKADIKNQSKSKIKQIKKDQQDGIVW